MATVSIDQVDGAFEFTFKMNSAENRALSAAVAVFMSAPDHVAQHILDDADADIEAYKDLLDGLSDAVVTEVSAYADRQAMSIADLGAKFRAELK